MDMRLLGLALANAQGGLDAGNRGIDTAIAQDEKLRAAQSGMMELALKDATFEDRQALMGLELLSKMPVLNQSMIDEETRAALSPFGRISSINPVMDLGLRGVPIPEAAVPGISTGDIGSGAKKVLEGYKTGVNPYPDSPQKGQRKPQAIVTPDEWNQDETFKALLKKGNPKAYDRVMSGNQLPWQVSVSNLTETEARVFSDIQSRLLDKFLGTRQQKVYDPASRARIINYDSSFPFMPNAGRSPQGDIVQPLEDQSADPVVEQALAETVRPTSIYSALRDPEFKRQMFDAMARTGSVPGTNIQTDRTFEALKGIRDAGFMAAKSSASLNQNAQEFQAKLEMERLKAQKDNFEFQLDQARKAGDSNAARTHEAQLKVIDSMMKLIDSQTVRPKSGSSKEDPNAADYRRQLNQFQTDFRNSVENQIKSLGGFVRPEMRARIVRDVIKSDPSIRNFLAELRQKADVYPAIARNYSGLFSEAGMPLGGAAPQQSSGGGTSRADRFKQAKEKKLGPQPTPRPTPKG